MARRFAVARPIPTLRLRQLLSCHPDAASQDLTGRAAGLRGPQAFLDGVRDEFRGAWVDTVEIGKVERGDVSDHDEIHQHCQACIAFATHGMNRNLAAQILHQPINALADARIFIPMPQEHGRVALQGQVVEAIPGHRFIVAGVGLLR